MERKEILHRGRRYRQAEWLPLACGPLALCFDPAFASLRSLRTGNIEIVRGIYVAVRDQNWDTIPPVLSNIQLRAQEKSFTLAFDATCRERAVDFVWHGEITGSETGTVCFTMDGEARQTFLRNRIGFCVLHPIRECVGQFCRVETVDGTIHDGVFPLEIAPHQPFVNMRAIAHEVLPGVWAEIRCEGDTFEMEDQRNWTDASFKTYCTPLALPYPVEIPVGTRLSQSVTLILRAELSAQTQKAAR